MRNNIYLFETNFIFKHSYSKNICIAHSFSDNKGRSIGPSVVFLIQSLEGREDKFSIICKSNPNCKIVTNIISHQTQVFKLKIQHKSNHIVRFKKLKTIMKSRKGLKTKSYLFSHVGTKFFPLNAHVHFLRGIKFDLQLQFILSKFHI